MSTATDFYGTRRLIRFVLRRDRVRLPVWIGSIWLLFISSAATYPSTFPERTDRLDRADMLNNPVGKVLTGPGYGVTEFDYPYGAMIANETISFTAIFVALMSIFLVVRHTRAEEESGRDELVRATSVGNRAGLVATLMVVGAANLVVGGLIAVTLPLTVEDLAFGSSVLIGSAIAMVGLVFTGVAAVTAQLTDYSRGANAMGVGAFGLAYVLRGLGDAGNGVLSWASPIGWSQATKAFVDDQWWPLLLSAALTTGLLALAFTLATRRDHAAGMLTSGAGRPRAPGWLTTPVGFAFRLHRAILIAWGAGIVLTGLAYGGFGDSVSDFAEDNNTMSDFLETAGGDDVVEQFFATFMALLALLAAGYGIQAILRLRSEEESGRAEPVLATPLSRSSWAGSHLVIALGGSAMLMALGGTGMGLTAAIAEDDASEIPRLLAAGLVQVPAVWVFIGLAIAVIGVVPRATSAVWAFLGVVAVVEMYGPLFDLPQWVTDLTPMGHVPRLPAESLTVAPLLALTAVATGLVAAGLISVRRRDLVLG